MLFTEDEPLKLLMSKGTNSSRTSSRGLLGRQANFSHPKSFNFLKRIEYMEKNKKV